MLLGMRSRLFIIASSEGIGGAESRTVKFANYAAENLDLDVNLVVNLTLLKAIEANKLLNQLISHSNLNITVYEPPLSRMLSEGNRNRILKDRRVKKLLRYLPLFMIRELSWYRFLKKNVTHKDIVHCIFGDTARLGSYFLASNSDAKDVPIIVEITSNRHVNTWGRHINFSLGKRLDESSLHINCVSETVKSNLLPEVRREHHGIIQAYSGPFMVIPRESNVSKQNVILFAHRFIPPKNPLIFAEAIRELFDEGRLKKWTVLIRGNGSLEPKIREILKPVIDAESVKIGYTNSLIEESKIAKIFVSIISTGNYPSQSLFESMRYGAVLILSDRGVTKEKLGEGEGIFYVKDISKDEVKSSLNKAIRIGESDSFTTYSENIEQTYDDMVAQNGYLNDVFEIYRKASQH